MIHSKVMYDHGSYLDLCAIFTLHFICILSYFWFRLTISLQVSFCFGKLPRHFPCKGICKRWNRSILWLLSPLLFDICGRLSFLLVHSEIILENKWHVICILVLTAQQMQFILFAVQVGVVFHFVFALVVILIASVRLHFEKVW